MSEYYTVIYNGKDLYSYEMTTQEKLVVETFRQELIDICNGLNIPRSKCADGTPYMGRLKDNYDFLIKYKDDISSTAG